MKISRKQIHEKYGGKCAYCGQDITIKQMQIDHIIPKRAYSKEHKCLIVGCRKFEEYGLNDIRNLAPACRPCNNFKSGMPLEDFRAEIAAQPQRLRRYRNQFRLAERFGLIIIIDNPVIFYFEKQQ